MPGTKRKSRGPLHLVDMQPNMTNFIGVALIIAKSEANIFLDKQNNEFRGVITFTLRDSRRHLVNCKCWGAKPMIDAYNEQLHMGDVVDIMHAKVMSLNTPNANERYQPRTTLHYALVINEGYGYLQKQHNIEAANIQELLQLQHVPHKPFCTALKLADVRSSNLKQQAAAGAQYVDLIVVVASLRPVKELKRKVPRNGTNALQCMELVVFDASWPDGMLLVLWHNEWIRRATQYWQPRKTVLHLIDVRVTYSEFHDCAVLNHAASTIIYENPLPHSEESKVLLAYAAIVPVKSFDIFAQLDLVNLPPAELIRTQMTVKQIYERAEGDLRDAATDQFTAVLYGTVTKLDLDGLVTNISKKCKSCQHLIPRNHVDCNNEACQLEFSLNYNGPRYDNFFNINIHISDLTGTLVEPRLTGSIAEYILRVQVDAFEHLTDRQKTDIKWRYLLKYVEVKLLIKKPNVMRRNLIIIVLDMQNIELDELIQKLAVF